jgi:glutamate--cysteine ligase
MVPHFVTALQGPLLHLERSILDAQPRIERWFRLEWQERTPPFYCSVDLRNAGFKIAPVDTNLYPGGFNNLSAEVLPLAVQAAMVGIEKYCPDAKGLLIVAESNTESANYRQNLARLSMLLRQTGLDVRIGSLSATITASLRLDLPDGQHLMLEPVMRRGRRVGLENFDPCAILLNNDLSAGLPAMLSNLQEQVLLPPLHAGWTVRRKTQHFSAYNDVVKKFAKLIDIDPWLLNPYFGHCKEVDFYERTGEQCLTSKVDVLLKQIRAKYKEYGITETPFVVVKANAGTYGMGIMTVKDAAAVANLDQLQQSSMSQRKEGLEVAEVMLQEGVPTVETTAGGTAEPVVYMIDKYVVGGFYRVNKTRGRDENLNSPDAQFVPLPFPSSCNLPDLSAPPSAGPNRFYTYGVVARLALLAASIELERTDPDPSRYG